jgi:hypothetical protein
MNSKLLALVMIIGGTAAAADISIGIRMGPPPMSLYRECAGAQPTSKARAFGPCTQRRCSGSAGYSTVLSP